MALDLQKVTIRKLLETQNHDFFTKLIPQFLQELILAYIQR